MRRRRAVVRARIPESQAPFVFLPGDHGGWFMNLLWRFGSGVDVPWQELRRLLAESSGDVMIARRLEKRELRRFMSFRRDIDHEIIAGLIPKDRDRWKRGRVARRTR